MAAANAAALSFLPPLASFTALICAAAFCLSTLSVMGGDLFFFLALPADGGDFFCFLAEPALGGLSGVAGRFTGLAGFIDIAFFSEVLDFPGGCWAPYIGM